MGLASLWRSSSLRIIFWCCYTELLREATLLCLFKGDILWKLWSWGSFACWAEINRCVCVDYNRALLVVFSLYILFRFQTVFSQNVPLISSIETYHQTICIQKPNLLGPSPRFCYNHSVLLQREKTQTGPDILCSFQSSLVGGYTEQPRNIISTCVHHYFMNFEIQLITKTLFFWYVDSWCV